MKLNFIKMTFVLPLIFASGCKTNNTLQAQLHIYKFDYGYVGLFKGTASQYVDIYNRENHKRVICGLGKNQYSRIFLGKSKKFASKDSFYSKKSQYKGVDDYNIESEAITHDNNTLVITSHFKKKNTRTYQLEYLAKCYNKKHKMIDLVSKTFAFKGTSKTIKLKGEKSFYYAYDNGAVLTECRGYITK